MTTTTAATTRLAEHKAWLDDPATGRRYIATNEDLRGADLTGADLRCADLRGANLAGAKLRGANLTRADLRWTDLGRG